MKSQFVTSSWGGIRKLLFAFSEHGVAMLSSVLRSKRAIEVNIEIMRAFVRMRALIDGSRALAKEINDLEQKYGEQFKVVFQAIYDLMDDREKKPKRKIGLKQKIGFV